MSNSILPILLDADDDDLTLPLIVAKKWDFRLAYVETDNGLYYAVHDWIQGLTATEDVRDIWANMRRNNKMFKTLAVADFCIKLPYRASNGRVYQIHYTSEEGLYRITQCLRSNIGIRDIILLAFVNGEIPRFQPDIQIKHQEAIYILRCEWPEYQNVYKIGRSRRPNDRLANFDHQFPFPITIITCLTVLKASRVESQLHQHFSRQRVRNEWFRLSVQDLDYALTFIGQQAAATSKLIGMDIATGKPLLE